MAAKHISGMDPRSNRCIRVGIEEGLIGRIEETNDETDLYISPGFVDLQVNGYAGFDLNAMEISADTVLGLVDVLLTHGVTCFAPTLISAPEERICRSLKAIAEARKMNSKAAACIPLVHVEGPSLSPLDGYRGAHPADALRPPSLAEFDRWQQAAEGLVGIVTLSPHFEETAAYITALRKQGGHVAIGHTHATADQISNAVAAGARLSTHLGNGIALHVPRHINPIWPQLAEDRLCATFIADGHHLPADVLKAMLKAKGIGHSVLISDSVALGGMPAGVYDTPIGGRVEVRDDGRLCVFGSEMLAGSAASLEQCIGQVVQMARVPLADALTMATVNPGRYVGDRGRLEPGARADLVRFRWNQAIEIEDVWLAGERVSTN